MKRTVRILAAIAMLLIAILAVRTGSRDVRPPRPDRIEAVVFDRSAAVERFAAALRIPTISHARSSGTPLDAEAFGAFRDLLARSYPRVHGVLRREIIAGHSLLYTWTGSDPGLDPIILMGHYDVVPVDPEAVDRWTHPPFAGEVADGFVWGRGAIDDKVNVIAQLEAVEALLEAGRAPVRTVLLAFGHDEELGGDEGASSIVDRLEAQGVRAALVLDEGGAVATRSPVPGLEAPVAAVGVAEKGFLTLDLRVTTQSGHSSVPPRHTAVGILATAIHRLERSPMPSHFEGVFRQTLLALGPALSIGPRIAIRNLWLFEPVVVALLDRIEVAGAMLRTTTAATMFDAGVKDNVLPDEAHAVVNFRIYPGERFEDVVDHVRRVIDDDRIEISMRDDRRLPSDVSSVRQPAFERLRASIAHFHPDAVVAPFLIAGGTDSRHYRRISDAVFGFLPIRAATEDARRAHGNDERLSTEAFVDAVGFYAHLIEQMEAAMPGERSAGEGPS